MLVRDSAVPEVDLSRVKPPFELSQIGEEYEESDSFPLDMIKADNMAIADYVQQKGLGTLITGQAGSWKTTRLVELIKKSDNPVVLCYTNKACDNIRERLPKRLQGCVHTLDSFFSDRSYDKLKGKDLFIDEYSMELNNWMNVIYDGYPIEVRPESSHVWRCQSDQPNRELQDYICSHRFELEYIKGSNRYDKELNSLLERIKS